MQEFLCLYSERGYVGQIFPAREDHANFSILLHLRNVPDLRVELC